MKKLEILGELPKCDTNTKRANALGKMVPMDLLNVELPQTSHLQEMQYLQSAIK